MDMTGDVYEQRGGYKPPERRPAEAGPELKEIDKIRADYVKTVRAAADVLAARSDYAGIEKELLKLKIFMSEGEINNLRRRLR
jgi:cyclopropane fatty-acyl-phospholipid synthase-like methyltransferase